MISKKAIDSIVQTVLSGKDPEKLRQDVAPATKEKAIRHTDNNTYMKRYYFYALGNEIKFSDLKNALEKDGPRTIVSLKGGMSGIYWADYFSWKKMIVKQSDVRGNILIYEADLNMDGTLGSKATLTPEGNGTPEDFANKNNLFIDRKGRMVIALDTSSDSLYSTDNPDGVVNQLRTQILSVGPKYKTYDLFKSEVFDKYRILDKSNNILVLPDNQSAAAIQGTPPGEEWSYGAYPGGQDAFKRYISKFDKGTPQENPEETQEVSNTVAPATPEVKQEDTMRLPGSKEPAQPTIPNTMPKQAVWQVIKGYTEKAAGYSPTTTTPATMNPSTSGSQKEISFPAGATSNITKQNNQNMQKYQKAQEEAERAVNQAKQQTTMPQKK